MSSREERAQLLGKTQIFNHLSKEECQRLAPVFKDRQLQDGETLCRAGDPGDYLAVVVLGSLQVEVPSPGGGNIVVAQVRGREVVGEMSCLDPMPRSATVRARGTTKVLLLTRTMLDSLKVNAPKLFSRVVRGIAYRLAGRLDETNAVIGGLIKVKRAPTQPSQPSLKELQKQARRGTPVRGEVSLVARGVLAGLSEAERKVLRSVMEAKKFGPNEVVCMEGEPAPEAYFVVQGSVEVLKNVEGKNYRLAEIGEGGLLGQRALLRSGTRSATLKAGSQGAVLLCLSRDRFSALLDAESSLAIGFQEVVTITGIRQLRQANEMAAYMGAREEKGQFPRALSGAKVRAPGGDSAREQLLEAVDLELEEESDIEVLASAFLETTLEQWDMTPSELDKIEVVTPEGLVSAAEAKLRNKS